MRKWFLYSQDLSNRKTNLDEYTVTEVFLYSQDLSNRKTRIGDYWVRQEFLYSQDLSNRKTYNRHESKQQCFCTLKI